MGTKSYVKPTRVHSHLLAGLCVNINEIQSPRPKEDAKVGKLVAIRYKKDELEKEANKLYNELSQKELEKIKELCNSCDDFHDDH